MDRNGFQYMVSRDLRFYLFWGLVQLAVMSAVR